MNRRTPLVSLTVLGAVVALALGASPQAWAQAQPQQARAMAPADARKGDHIVAIVGQDLVTAFEVDRRLVLVRDEFTSGGRALPPASELEKRVLDALIDERVVLVHARESGVRVDEAELDRAVQSVAAQNKLTVVQLREQLRNDGLDYTRFRADIRDQLLVERVREREVLGRIKIGDLEVDDFLAKQGARGRAGELELNLAQILVSLPEQPDDAAVARARAKAEAALARVVAREDFAAVAKAVSDGSAADKGGEIGLRAANRLPDAFVDAARRLRVGEVTPALVRTGAGFHILKVLERKDAQDTSVVHTRARHILVRPAAQASADAVQRQLLDLKRQIEAGRLTFEDAARRNSQDGSAEQGGDLGFAPPGSYVPEFEAAMNALRPGQMSEPIATRYGLHLIQVVERKDVVVTSKQLREQARNALREQRWGQAFGEWLDELRGRAYIERRDAPTS
jgi:peptidyl-prolyl cis-trans isomerase SurA